MDRKRLGYGGLLGAVIVTSLAVDTLGIGDSAGKAYCILRHPVEALTSERTTCERQHVIQRQHGGADDVNTVWINAVEHDYADRSRDAPWTASWEGMWGDWGDDNLKRAYKMGVYANGYHFLVYDYRGDGETTLLEWDGASHLTYMVGSVANFITKELSYIGYQWHEAGDRSQYLDAILGVLIDLAEVAVGLGYGAVGVVVGTLLNPLDTAGNLAGMVVYSAEAIVVGVWNTLADILSILTLGWAQLQSANL